MRIKRDFLRRLILSMLLIVLLPALAVYLYLIPKQREGQMNALLRDALNDVSEAALRFESSIGRMYVLNIELYENKRFHPYYLKSGVMAEYEAHEDLARMFYADTLVYTVAIYISETDRLYSNRFVSAPLESVSKTYYAPESCDPAALRALIRAADQPVLLPAGRVNVGGPAAATASNREVIAFIAPYPWVGNSIGSLIVYLDAEPLLEPLKNCLKGEGGVFIASRAQGYVAGDREAYEFAAPLLGEGAEASYALAGAGGEETLVRMAPSNVNDWIYCAVCPADDVLAAYGDSWRGAVTWMVVLTALEFAFIAYVLRRVYAPIQSTLSVVCAQLNAGPPKTILQTNRDIGEMDAVRDAFSEIRYLNEQYGQRLREAQPALKMFLLQGLFGGCYEDAEQFNRDAASCELEMRHPYWAVAAIRVRDREESGRARDLRLMAEFSRSYEGMGVDLYFLPDMEPDSHLCVINARRADAKLKELFEPLIMLLTASEGATAYIGIGAFSERLRDISGSREQARHALERLMLRSASGVLSYADCARTEDDYSGRAADALEMLSLSIENRRARQLTDMVSALCEALMDPSLSPQTARHIIVSARGILLNGISAYEKGGAPAGDAIELLRGSGAEICDALRLWAERLAAHLEKDEKARSVIQTEQIMQYVRAHYLDEDCSAELIAARFAMSQPAFSELIKHRTGYTFTEHVNALKIEHANRLLSDTRMSMQEIAETLKYANASSFGRTYKRVTGVSPGVYRSLCQGKSSQT